MRELIDRIRINMRTPPAPHCGAFSFCSSENPARVDLAKFLKNVSRQTLQPPSRIKINFSNIHVSGDTAVYCGFILKELLASAMPVPGGDKGRVIIDLFPEGNIINLVISDDGCCFPKEMDSESMSARLVTFLAGQINGVIEFNRSSITEISLRFSEPGILEALLL